MDHDFYSLCTLRLDRVAMKKPASGWGGSPQKGRALSHSLHDKVDLRSEDGIWWSFILFHHHHGWLMGGIYLDWLLFTEGWLLPNKLSNNHHCRFSTRRVAQHIEVWSLMDFLQSVFGRWWICFLIRSVSVIMAVVLQQKSAFHDTCTYTVWSEP